MCGRARYSALSVAKIDQLTHSTAGQEAKKSEDNKTETTFIENLSPGMSVPVILMKQVGAAGRRHLGILFSTYSFVLLLAVWLRRWDHSYARTDDEGHDEDDEAPQSKID